MKDERVREIAGNALQEYCNLGPQTAVRLQTIIASTIRTALAEENAESRAELARVRQQYEELLFQVGKKYPGESRHETALRYLKAAEAVTDNTARCAMKEKK